jgi:hypothetical protein
MGAILQIALLCLIAKQRAMLFMPRLRMAMIDLPDDALKASERALHGIAFHTRAQYSTALISVASAILDRENATLDRAAKVARSFDKSLMSMTREDVQACEIAAAIISLKS